MVVVAAVWWWLKLHILALVASANDECTFVPHFADSGLFFWLPGDRNLTLCPNH